MSGWVDSSRPVYKYLLSCLFSRVGIRSCFCLSAVCACFTCRATNLPIRMSTYLPTKKKSHPLIPSDFCAATCLFLPGQSRSSLSASSSALGRALDNSTGLLSSRSHAGTFQRAFLFPLSSAEASSPPSWVRTKYAPLFLVHIFSPVYIVLSHV